VVGNGDCGTLVRDPLSLVARMSVEIRNCPSPRNVRGQGVWGGRCRREIFALALGPQGGSEKKGCGAGRWDGSIKNRRHFSRIFRGLGDFKAEKGLVGAGTHVRRLTAGQASTIFNRSCFGA